MKKRVTTKAKSTKKASVKKTRSGIHNGLYATQHDVIIIVGGGLVVILLCMFFFLTV